MHSSHKGRQSQSTGYQNIQCNAFGISLLMNLQKFAFNEPLPTRVYSSQLRDTAQHTE
jgi:hypothetical protein